MLKSRPALLVGESWMTVTTHHKGFNHFVSGGYETGLAWFRGAMEERGVEFVHMPAHEAAEDFPLEQGGLEEYGAVTLSDVGADTLLLHPRTWLHGERTPNRVRLIAEYVEGVGGLVRLITDRRWGEEFFRDKGRLIVTGVMASSLIVQVLMTVLLNFF